MYETKRFTIEIRNQGQLGPFFRLHLFFTADDIAGIYTPANFIHCDSKSTHAAFVNIALLYNLFPNLFYCLLLNHDFLLSRVLANNALRITLASGFLNFLIGFDQLFNLPPIKRIFGKKTINPILGSSISIFN